MNILLKSQKNNWKCVKNTENKKVVEYGSKNHQLFFFRRANSQEYNLEVTKYDT